MNGDELRLLQMKLEEVLKEDSDPGLDGISNVALKGPIKKAPDLFVHMYNRCLQERSFRAEWKQKKLVLLSQRNKHPDEPCSYVPLFILNPAEKLP